MHRSIALGLILLAGGGCAARFDDPSVPGWARADNPPVARFESCNQMWRAGWHGGVSATGGSVSQQVYELNLHLAYDVGHACRPLGPSSELPSVGAPAPSLVQWQDAASTTGPRRPPKAPPIHNMVD